MSINVAINGFGRIGRAVLKIARKTNNIKVVAINDLVDAYTLAYLLKHDSVHGPHREPIRAQDSGIAIGEDIGSWFIRTYSKKDPANLPWKNLEVDVVIESTGKFRTHSDAAKHLKAGAKKVIISAPAKDEVDGNFVIGVNDGLYKSNQHHIITIGSCTTNCLAPLVWVINQEFGLVEGLMTTIHSYTSDQCLLDLPHNDLRRARAAALSMIPTSTGAAKAISLIIPEVAGKLDGCAVRVPTPNVSLVDLVARVDKPVTTMSVNNAFRRYAEGNSMSGVLEYCHEPLVSVDFNGNPHACIFDSLATLTIGKNTIKVFGWYDNEWGFATNMVEMIKKMMP